MLLYASKSRNPCPLMLTRMHLSSPLDSAFLASSIPALIACARFSRHEPPLGLEEELRGLEHQDLVARVRHRLHVALVPERADYGGGRMVPEAVRLDGGHRRFVAQRVHLHEGRVPRRVPEVVPVLPLHQVGRPPTGPPGTRTPSSSASTSPRNGSAMPPKFEPPPRQPMMRSGESSTFSN